MALAFTSINVQLRKMIQVHHPEKRSYGKQVFALKFKLSNQSNQ